jgi:hypothetical protein
MHIKSDAYPVPLYQLYHGKEIIAEDMDYHTFCDMIYHYMLNNTGIAISKHTVWLSKDDYTWCEICLEVECKKCEHDYIHCNRNGVCYD